jgi:hypothetical protein
VSTARHEYGSIGRKNYERLTLRDEVWHGASFLNNDPLRAHRVVLLVVEPWDRPGDPHARGYLRRAVMKDEGRPRCLETFS